VSSFEPAHAPDQPSPRPPDTLRLITCGSVDDGKSTLIGRLLFDTGAAFTDELEALARTGFRADGALDYSLLVDGLIAERAQGITIDVAYRSFATPKRAFIVADAPGHEQYTRNMVTGASTADLALMLVDARKGVLTQTRRHLYLVSLMGVRSVALAVNKMDLVDWSQARFDAIAEDFRAYARALGVERVHVTPTAALSGDNLVFKSAHTPWHDGAPLLDYLEAAPASAAPLSGLRMAVQGVTRAGQDFRGFTGRIASGAVRPGEEVVIAPSGARTRIARIVTMDGELPAARAGQSVTLTFTDEVDCSRGDVVCAAAARAEIADQFETTIIWMSDEPLLAGRSYGLKIGTTFASAQITAIKHTINVNTLEKTSARSLRLNDIAVCNISLDRMVAFDAFRDNRETGGFILIDRASNNTVGAGLIHFSLRRAQNVHWQTLSITRAARAELMGQRAAVLWFTGLSGAGKSTIADLVDKKLYSLGRRTVLLDGDNVRHGLNRDLGFTDADRVENIRRVAEVAKLMADSGLIVLVSFISPFQAERDMARALIPPGDFYEIHVDTPLELAEQRDVKGLYKKARSGQLKNFTGIDSPYERPQSPEIRIDTTGLDPASAAEAIVARLLEDDALLHR